MQFGQLRAHRFACLRRAIHCRLSPLLQVGHLIEQFLRPGRQRLFQLLDFRARIRESVRCFRLFQFKSRLSLFELLLLRGDGRFGGAHFFVAIVEYRRFFVGQAPCRGCIRANSSICFN